MTDGLEGEIAVESRHLSLGYVVHGVVSLPADRGISEDGVEIYYTGDRGVRLPSGDIELIGRADDQLKICGYRVDLSEVTAALLSLPGIGEAIALPMKRDGAPRIEAFVSVETGVGLSAASIARSLAEALPAYMVPSRIVLLDSRLPRLPNGKIDRKLLSAELSQSQTRRAALSPLHPKMRPRRT